MAEAKTITRTTPARTVTQHSINWGAVVKGAAIVGAVVLVGVVAYSFAAPLIAGSPTALGILGGIGEAASAVGGFLWQGLTFLGGMIGEGFTMLFPNIANAATAAQVAPGVLPQVGGAAAGVLAVGGAVALTGAHHQLADAGGHLIVQETVRIPEQTTTEVIPTHAPSHPETNPSLAGHHSNEIAAKNAELGRHASEQADEYRNTVRDRRSTSASSATWTERVPQAGEKRRNVSPRQESHTAQIDQEQSLSALAEATR